jgi:hypothetical protein
MAAVPVRIIARFTVAIVMAELRAVCPAPLQCCQKSLDAKTRLKTRLPKKA